MFRFISARVPAFAVIAQQVRGISLNDTLKAPEGKASHQKTSGMTGAGQKISEKAFSGKSDGTDTAKLAKKIADTEAKNWEVSTEAPSSAHSFQKTHGARTNVELAKEEPAQKRMEKEAAALSEPRGQRRDPTKYDGTA